MARPLRVQTGLNQDRARVDRIQSMLIETTTVGCKVLLSGSGEVSVDVSFPVWFSEEPFFYFGGVLGDNHSPQETNFPVQSATVVRWDTKEASQQRTYWKGATVGCVALGQEGQEIRLHLLFTGKAFKNPTNDPNDPEDES